MAGLSTGGGSPSASSASSSSSQTSVGGTGINFGAFNAGGGVSSNYTLLIVGVVALGALYFLKRKK